MSAFWQGICWGAGATLVAIAMLFIWACCKLDERSDEWRDQWDPDPYGVTD